MDSENGSQRGQDRVDASEAAPYVIDWTETADRLGSVAQDQAGWYAAVAGDLVGAPHQAIVAVDVGCGGGGMTAALAAQLDESCVVVAVDATPEVLAAAEQNVAAAAPASGARVVFIQADLADGVDRLRMALDRPADLIWASASVHHLGDQQAAVDALASLLAPGGRLALAEGGLRARHLPWDVGVGQPGLEMRLDVAQDLWFARMRDELPGSTRMPYGWTEALRRARLVGVTTRSMLMERSAPLADADRDRVLESLAHQVDRIRPTDLLDAADVAVWDRLLDPADPAWLGNRDDLYMLEVRSVHIAISK
jgi:SAM-dependent methyltransferase